MALSIGLLGLGAGRSSVAPAACLLFGWAFVAATSAQIAWAAQLVPGRAASGTAALFIILTLGQAVGSTVVGLVADHGGMSLAFLVAAGLAVVAAVIPGVAPRPPAPARAAGRPAAVGP